MKAATVLFWKELRENAKWAAIGALAMAISLAYAINQVDANNNPDMLSRIWSGINMTVAIGAPVLGVALACLRILPERTRDRWAFLIHRPADRFALFAGKAAAGICLLLAATVIPLVGIAIWMQTPGNIAAPFDWGMMEAGFASIAVGIAFYFAGMLAAIRPACWYGSRLMPIPAAIVCAVLCSVVPEFWQALAITVLFAVVIGLAAWDSFRMASGHHVGKLAGRFSLGVTLATGIALTGVVIVAILVSSWQAVQPPRSEFHGLAWASVPQTTEDGQVVRVRRNTGVADVVSDDNVELGDVNYNPISVGDPQKWVASHPLFDMHDIDTRLRPVSERWPRYDETSRYATVIGTQSVDANDLTIRYVCHGLILMYSERSRTLVGAIGTNGYRRADTVDDAMGAGPFSVNQSAIVDQPALFLAARDAVYSVGSKSLSPLLIGQDAGQCRSVSTVQVSVRHTPMTLIVISTTTAFHIIGGDRPTITLPRHYGPDLCNSVFLGVTGNGRFVLCYMQGAGGARAAASSHIEEFDKDGNRLNGYTVAPETATSWASMDHTDNTSRLLVVLSGFITPSVVVPIGGFLLLSNNSPEAREFAAQFVGSVWFFTFLIGSAMAGLICALITWRIARRCAFGRGLTAAWVAGNVFLSWIGVLVMIALRPIPIREPCEGCGIPRVVTRETCEHCGSSWPAAKRDGTEIFDEPAEMVRLAV